MRIINDGVQNIETYLLNTETGTLRRANTRNVLQIGKQTTNGLGAGANEIIGEKAALESREQIRKNRYAIFNCRNGWRNRNWSNTSNS